MTKQLPNDVLYIVQKRTPAARANVEVVFRAAVPGAFGLETLNQFRTTEPANRFEVLTESQYRTKIKARDRMRARAAGA